MIFQQMKISDSIKIEADGVQSPTDQSSNNSCMNITTTNSSQKSLVNTPSISFGNYNIQRNNISHKQSPLEPFKTQLSPTDKKITTNASNPTQRSPLRPVLPDSYSASSLTRIYFYFGNFSQSIACIATRFGECSLTLLHKLWYFYSYIYHQLSSNTTTIIVTILLFVVVVILMTTTHHTGMQYGRTCRSKASPIEWLRQWL